MLPEPHRFARRILAVIVQIDDVRAARVTPAGEHRVVLAEIPRVLDERDRQRGAVRTSSRQTLHRVVDAAVVDEHDLVPALDVELFDVVDQRRDRLGAVVKRE